MSLQVGGSPPLFHFGGQEELFASVIFPEKDAGQKKSLVRVAHFVHFLILKAQAWPTFVSLLFNFGSDK